MSGMGRKTIVSFLIASSLLFSCGNERNGESDSSNKQNISAYIDQNGDYGHIEISSYSSLPSLSPSSFIYKAEKGLAGLFIDAHEDCSHCLKFEPKCLAALEKTGFYMESLYRDDNEESSSAYKNTLQILQNKYGSERGNGGINGSTPSIYLGEKAGLTLLDFYSDSDNANRFASYLTSLFTKTEIYHFSSFSSFKSEYEKSNQSALAFFIDESKEETMSFYAEYLYPLAKLSKKSLYYVDIARLNDDDRSAFASYFSFPSLSSSLILDGEKADYLKSEADAASLINDYYS